MSVFRVEMPANSELTPCPMGCGRMTEDPAGGPCHACWALVSEEQEPCCESCGKGLYDWAISGANDAMHVSVPGGTRAVGLGRAG